MTLNELRKTYGGNFVEIKDKDEALKQLGSRSSCCWGAGAEFGDSGWIALAFPSPCRAGHPKSTLVCRKELISSELGKESQ